MNKYQLNSCHVTHRFVLENTTETEKKILELLKLLQKNEHKNVVVSTLAGKNRITENYNGLQIRRFAHKYPFWILKQKDREFLDETFGNPFCKPINKFLLSQKDIDIFHIHTTGRIAESVQKIALKNKIPYIVSVYPEPEQMHLEKLNKIKKRMIDYGKFFDLFSKHNDLLSEAAGFICYSQKKYVNLKKNYPDKIIIPASCGINLEDFRVAGTHKFRKKYKISPIAEMILLEADIETKSNQMRLLELAEYLRSQKENFHFLFIGKISSENYLKQLQKKIEVAKLQKKVTIISDLSSDSDMLKQAYETADYFINPSPNKPCEESVLKAWSNRLPIISYKNKFSELLIQNKKNGFLYKKDTLKSLVDALNFMRTNSGFRVRLIQNSFDYLVNNFTRDKIHGKILELYLKTIQRSSE